MKQVLLLAALCASSVPSLLAQSASGTILGSVKDPSAAGVTTGQQGGNIEGSGAFVQRGTGSFNANGQRGQNNNFMVDGIDNNESWINSTILQPAVEATREFKVYTANAPAEFGRSTGGTVNVQTRSGTNDFH